MKSLFTAILLFSFFTTYRAMAAPVECTTNCTDSAVVGLDNTGLVDVTDAVQRMINRSVAGDTIVFRSGTYLISRPLRFKAGLNFVGESALWSKPLTESALTLAIDDLSDISFDGLSFRNIRFVLNGTTQASLQNITFINCTFRHTKSLDNNQNFHFIAVRTAKNIQIDTCKFIRGSGYVGRGIAFNAVHESSIRSSLFEGYFKTAINVSGAEVTRIGIPLLRERNYMIKIIGNTISRTRGGYESDHGIYAWGVKDLVINGNVIRGWGLNYTGGSIKLSNSSVVRIVKNQMFNSGVLMELTERKRPHEFEDIKIRDNLIDISVIFRDNNEDYLRGQPGIGYDNYLGMWEKSNSVQIFNNEIINGSIYIDAVNYRDAFNIYDNKATYVRVF